MSRIIPNENTWVGFTPEIASADLSTVTEAELTAAVELQKWLISINASTQGNTVPTPSIDTLFETSIAGTVQASFTADFYRDDENDLAWDTLPRGARGYMLISRFGGTGAGTNKPTASDPIEVWPLLVVSRTNSNLSNNTVLTFTVTGSVPEEPNENAAVGA